MADPHLGKLDSSHVASWSNSIEMSENETGLRGSSGDNNNFLRSSSETAELLQMAALNGANNFAIFLFSKESGALPRKNPYAVKMEIKDKISRENAITNLRYTRLGTMLFFTQDVDCAIEISQLTNFLGVQVHSKVLFENITNRFLLYNIPLSVNLGDLAYEIESSNEIHILELRRFVKRDTSPEASPVLITSLGTLLPTELKIWYSIHHVKQFIDRPRQCRRCFKFNHTEIKCKNAEKICVTCGSSHGGSCSLPMACINCKGEHRADFLQCPFRKKEEEFLRFKCSNFLTFSEARRKFVKNSDSYAKKVKTPTVEPKEIQSFIERRTNAMIQVLNEVMSQKHIETIEALKSIQNIISTFIATLREGEPPLKRKT